LNKYVLRYAVDTNNPPCNGGFTLFEQVCPPLCGGQQ